MADIFDMTKTELQEFLVTRGMKKFRADQIFHYIYKQHIFSWDDMVLLPKGDREKLKAELPICFPEILSKLESPDGQTVKLLLSLHDGNTVETVLMMHDYGNSICLSSQVGCAVNCAFCASAKNGFVRNLTAGEMVAQLMAFRKYVTPELHSIVIMGTGEPLLNYDNVVRFMKMIHEKDTLYLGYRNMPITDTYPVADVLKAADHYFQKTGRKVTFEYILIQGVNCSTACARELAELFSGKNILINAIPINDNYDVGLYRPSAGEINSFIAYLQKRGINVTLRREMGSQIQAACGQLRIKRENI